jgi:hypothetical protein
MITQDRPLVAKKCANPDAAQKNLASSHVDERAQKAHAD